MMTALSIVLFGFLLGMRHAMDADHVVAVTTIVSRERSVRQAALIGALWGIGHTVTVVLAGGVILWLGVVIPRRTGLAMEFSVALMLIALGLLNLRDILSWVSQRRELERETNSATALPGKLAGAGKRLARMELLRPLIVGIVHGLAGSAALALLVLPIIHEPPWALAYLIIFGLGTIAGMMLFTAAIALPFTCASRCSPVLNRPLGVAASFFSVGFGLFLAYEIGFVEGLFTR